MLKSLINTSPCRSITKKQQSSVRGIKYSQIPFCELINWLRDRGIKTDKPTLRCSSESIKYFLPPRLRDRELSKKFSELDLKPAKLSYHHRWMCAVPIYLCHIHFYFLSFHMCVLLVDIFSF